jgi:hypothetical protein
MESKQLEHLTMFPPGAHRDAEGRGASMNYSLNFHDYLNKITKAEGGRCAPRAPLDTPLMQDDRIEFYRDSSSKYTLTYLLS